MNTETLDTILSCPSLPSLPAVAVRVIELTSDENVRMEDLAATIQGDQALAAKILRTVNSSFYGLRQKCTSIQKALVLLGLGPVKSLALGFSLVATLDSDESSFDWTDYWRRGLHTAVGAQLCARHVAGADPDEAFLAGLLQDIGMVAAHRALGDEYAKVLEAAGGDHRKLAKHELSALEIQHPEIGAMLAQRWRLPSELVIPVRYHERPSASPNTHSNLVRLVGLGNLAHDTLVAEDPSVPMRKFYTKAKDWFKMDSETCQSVLRDIALAAEEMSKTLGLDTGDSINIDEVIAVAEDRLAKMSIGLSEDVVISRNTAALLEKHGSLDAYTGVLGREALTEVCEQAYYLLSSENEPFSVVHVLILGADDQRQAHKMDDVLIGVIALLRKYFEPGGGVLCRIRNDLFTVVLPGGNQAEATQLANAFALDFKRYAERRMEDLDQFKVVGAIGVATADESTLSTFSKPDQVIMAALQAVRSSAKASPFAVRAFQPTKPESGSSVAA